MQTHKGIRRERRYVLKQQGVEIQLSQQRLFHLTVCPCVNGNVNSELKLKGRDGWRKQPVATSTLGPPYVTCVNIYAAEHTHSVNYTPLNHQRTHTQGHSPMKTLSENISTLLGYICWRMSLSDTNFPTLRLRQDATCWQSCELPISCSPHARTL